MKYSIQAIIMTVCMLAMPLAAVAAQPQAEQVAKEALAKNMANSVLSMVKDQQKAPRDRQATLQNGFANVVDIDWIAKFVLGSAWRTATDEQRARYTTLYRRYLTQTYVSNYAESGERQITDIKVVGVNDVDDERFTARTRIMLSNADNIQVDYLVNGKPGNYKIIDVVIEGVSLLATHRSQFGKIAAAQGVDGVIAQLEQLISASSPT